MLVDGGTTLYGNLSVTGSSTLRGEVTSVGPLSGFAAVNRADAAKRWVMYSRNTGTSDRLAFFSNQTGDVATIDQSGNLRVKGTLSPNGADLAEAFETTEVGPLEPGSVVVIDEDNPGKLKLSTEANDPHVAGIISGAGGVKTGVLLQQEGVLEGEHHVALSGRVYVKGDATTLPIRPGDMLTTSNKPGHAMRVGRKADAFGTVIGKAMSRLDEGTGLVLLLVSLQ